MFPTIRRMLLLVLAAGLFVAPATPQQGLIYSATVVPSIAVSGGSVNIRMQIVSFTTDAEKANLKEVFATGGSDKGLALLKTLSHGYINLAQQQGRKIFAAFSFDNEDGRRIILVTEHVLSEWERRQGVNPNDYPLTILRMRFDRMGNSLGGEVIPAGKITVTKDGFVDMATEYPTTATMTNIQRVN
jgi:hypothetical protein